DSSSRLVRQVETRAVEAEERCSAHELAVARCAEHAEETIASRCATFADRATEAATALNDRVRMHADTCSTIERELREELQRIVERIRSDTERAIVDTRIDSRRSRSSSVSIVAEAETAETAAPIAPMVGGRLGSSHTDSDA